jgi:hypothetical protein
VYEAVAARRLPQEFVDSLKAELRYNPRIDAGYDAALRENLLPRLTARHEEIQAKFERLEAEPQPEYDAAELFGLPALFTYERVDRAKLPEGLFAYDVRHDANWEFAAIEPIAAVNYANYYHRRAAGVRQKWVSATRRRAEFSQRNSDA